MWLDVSELRQFYQSPLGQTARRAIRRRVRELWPDLTGLRLLTLGFGTPFVGHYIGEAERVCAVMPAAQGVIRWPTDRRVRVALAEETQLPFADATFDRVLLVHAVEFSESLRPMLREVWRVLADGGRLMVVAPNRRGVWARLERTPFGHGLPYTPNQLDRLLRDGMFLPTVRARALYLPPTRSRFLLGLATAWEGFGGRWLRPFSGVILTEAEKQVYAANSVAARRGRRPRPVLSPELGFNRHRNQGETWRI